MNNKRYEDRIYDAAMAYRDKGLSVIPLRENKRPVFEWREYQSRLADYLEIKDWCERMPWMGIGIVTGHISKIVVMDLDNMEAQEFVKRKGLPHTPIAKTSKGVHIYMKMNPDDEWSNRSFQDLGIDIRAEGGYVVAPPSRHPSGHYYMWTDWHPWNCFFSPPVEWMYEYLQESREGGLKERGWQNSLLAGVSSGGRNHATASLAGRLLTKGLTGDEVLEILLMWNETRNKPPLPEWEVERTVDSIVARDRRRNG